jgi:hypothetical protein
MCDFPRYARKIAHNMIGKHHAAGILSLSKGRQKSGFRPSKPPAKQARAYIVSWSATTV